MNRERPSFSIENIIESSSTPKTPPQSEMNYTIPPCVLSTLAAQQAALASNPLLQYNRLVTFQSHLNHLALSLEATAAAQTQPTWQNRLPPWNHIWPKSRRKGGQVRFTAEQTNTLEARFDTEKYLSPNDRRKLAKKLDLSERQVKTWFQNRRAKWRRQKSEDSPDEGKPTSFESSEDDVEEI